MDRTVDYSDGIITIIDQTRIPHALVTVQLHTPEEVAKAIRTMQVRGAPAIGVAAAAAVACAARNYRGSDSTDLLRKLEQTAVILRATRPTAVNLFWGIDRMLQAARSSIDNGASVPQVAAVLDALAASLICEDEEANRQIGRYGAALLPDPVNVLTHCNAGALACVSYGTALGVIRAAVESGKNVHVYADETRPRLQGMKLTCFELVSDNIPVTLISDNMAGSLMRKGKIDCVVVGSDRIAANGDVANKIGTYSVAVLAKHHNLPFYVAAPISTIDFALANGDDIPIEERPIEEVTHIEGMRIAPENVNVINPSFDVTPAALITAIFTEKGIAYPPYKDSLDQWSPEV